MAETVTLAHKIALEPTPEQEKYFWQAAGTARFVWNWALDEWNKYYEEQGKSPKACALQKQFNAIKKAQYPWITGIGCWPYHKAFEDLGKAWQAYFRKLKNGDIQRLKKNRQKRGRKVSSRLGQPRFKSRKSSRPSFYVHNQSLKCNDRSVKIPKAGIIRTRESLRFDGKIMGGRITFHGDRWYISIQVQMAEEYCRKRSDNQVTGVDLGVKSLATLSTGKQIEGPKPLDKALKKLRRMSRRHSRMKDGSENKKKHTRKLAKFHARITHIRQDALHKLTTRLCRENQAIGIEDLNVSGMSANHKLSRRINDMGFHEFRRQLEYKGPLHGTKIVEAPRFYASSKTCSRCGEKKEDLKLSDRVFRCECGFAEDRDVNAAMNLRTLALRETNACGHDGSDLKGGSRQLSGPTSVGEAGTRNAHNGKPGSGKG